MLTSRAEFRLILRHDNADLRLREIAYKIGTISKEQHDRLEEKKKNIQKLTKELENTKLVLNEDVRKIFKKNKIDIPKQNITYADALKRPEITMEFLSNFHEFKYDSEVIYQVEINYKYGGYIEKAYKEAEKLQKIEEKQIPEDIDYHKIKNLASEAKQKLDKIRPRTIAQASRISGVNPADMAILAVYLKKEYSKHE